MRFRRALSHSAALLLSLVLLAPAMSAGAQGPSFPAEVNKQFNPISIVAGEVSRLSVTIYNPNSFQLDNAAWIDDLVGVQPGITIANPVNLTNTCGVLSVVVAVPGGTSLSLSGGTVPAQLGADPGQCTVAIDVTSTTPGNLINTIPAGGLTATGGGGDVTNTTPASATLRVGLVQPPSLSKTFAPNTMYIGESSLLTITLRNNDLYTPLTQLSLTDTLPANVTVVGPGSPAQSGCGSATLTANSGDGFVTLSNATVIPSTSCLVRVYVTSSVQGANVNTIPAGAISTRQGVTNAAAASAPLNVQAIRVTKAFSPTSFVAGSTTTLTITLYNPTATPYTAVSVSDTLPGTVLTVVDGSAATTCGGSATTSLPRTASLVGGTIPAGTAAVPGTPGTPAVPGTCTITVLVTAPAGASAATYTNTIPAGALTATGPTGPITSLSSASANVSVYRAGTGVTGSKAFSPSTINPGGNSRLSITIAAPLDTPAPGLTGLTVVDNLPLGITISNSSPATRTNCGAGSVLTAPLGGTTITLTNGTVTRPNSCVIGVSVTGNVANTYTNVITPADITSLEGRTLAGNLQATLTITPVVPPSNFTISKSFYPNTVNPNGLSALTITLQNTNAAALINVSLVDTLPGNTTNGVVVAPIPNASTTCGAGVITAVPGTLTISMADGTVPAQLGGVPGICTITVDVQGRGATATRTNTLVRTNVTGEIEGTGTVVNPVANATANLTIANMTVGIVKGFDPLTVFGGSASTLSVQLTNPNNAVLAGIAFTDTMPAGMIIANPANLSVGTCGGLLNGAPGDGSFSFSGGTLAPAATCTLSLSVTMTVNGNLTNTIPALAVTTRNGATNPQPAEASLTNLPGASVSKVFAPNPISNGSGDYSLLTITIQNTSSFSLTGMGLLDTLPAGLEIAAAPAPVNNCGGTLTADAGTQIIRLTGGTLAGSSSCTLAVPVRGSTIGDYQNCIPVDALTNDQGARNHEPACDTLTVTAPVIIDPAVTKGVDPASAEIGETVTFTLIVTNEGNASASNVELVDPIPAFLDIISVVIAPDDGPTTSIVGNTVTIAFGTLDEDEVYTVTITTVVNSRGAPPGGTNSASVTTTSADADPDNNADSALVTITGGAADAPATGFAPGRMTALPAQPADRAYATLGDLWIEIPALGVRLPIVGVPQTKDGWDVTWLGSQAGYLYGTAFPTWKGNSVITSHVTLPSGRAGPFSNLKNLRWDDQVIVHYAGQRHVYSVRTTSAVSAGHPSIFRHEDRSWLTLVTCGGYDNASGEYRYRVVVKAVLTSIEPEP